MLIAIPSEAPGGLDARISEHFGHCHCFTLVQLDDGQVGEVTVLPNGEHSQGGCMGPVMLLKGKGVTALVAGGMGMRPLSGFQQVGIAVHSREQADTVGEAVERFVAGDCPEFGTQHTCGGHDGGCGHDHHQHQPPPMEPVDGPVEDGRVVRIAYEIAEAGGQPIDAADDVRYVHGQQQIMAGLEQAITGHVAGDSFEVTLSPEQGFGPHDPQQTMEVPLSQLPEGVTPGVMLQTQTPDGRMVPLTVASIDGEVATLDANHPLAGKTVEVKVKVLEVLRVLDEPAE